MKKVFVGLSGGVDSSVSAYLLKQAGYNVTGVYIKAWQPEWIECTWKEDRLSALRTAAYLDIPFLTFDAEQKYKDAVVNYILEEYQKGNTPNPDMLCNKEIKFGVFLDWAKNEGADYVATGHYASISGFQLQEPKDKEKDQTYFLSQLTQKQLQDIIFPLGNLYKQEVRKIAHRIGLPVATRKDSQGICFVGDMSMKDFLKKELNPKKGEVRNKKDEVIGEHDGAILYTLGERHGFSIKNTETTSEVYYVVRKDIEKNILYVDHEKFNKEKNNKQLLVKNVSLIAEEVKIGEILDIRTRYRGKKYKVKLVSLENGVYKFESQEEIEQSLGQFAVFYSDENLLGGGVIV